MNRIGIALRIIIVGVAVLSWAHAAFAEDASETAAWGGLYVGAGFGASNSSADTDYTHNISTCSNNNFGSNGSGCGGNQDYATKFTSKHANLAGSLDAEYDWTISAALLGVEPVAYFGTGLNKTHNEVVSTAFGDTLSIKTEQDYLAALRANVGVPIDNFLLYATGGASIGGVRTDINQTAGGSTPKIFHKDETMVGYLAGAGAKYMLPGNWVIGGELLYIDLGRSSFSSPSTVIGGGITYPNTNLSSEYVVKIAQLTLSYKF